MSTPKQNVPKSKGPSLRERYEKLTPGGRKAVWYCSLISGAIILGLFGYSAKSDPVPVSSAKETFKEIALEPDLIEKTTLREQRAELAALRQELTRLKESPQPERISPPPIHVPSADELTGEKKPSKEPPPLPIKTAAYPPPPMPNAGKTPPPPVQDEIIGGIGVLSNPNKDKKQDEDKKKEGRKIYLPPSIMTAQLLTGFDAATTNGGKGSPEPLLLRIQAPAILPNDVMASVRGCFVIAEAVGRLDKERADVRLVSMACLSNKGQSVIDESIKGFVTDADAKVGLSARIVSKAGSATARALLAGLIKGAGDALSESSTDQFVSGVTGVTTTSMSNDTTDMARRAAGEGISEAADTLSDYFMDLARQTGPVAEVKADRKVTIVISEGKELTIKTVDTKTGV